MPVPVPVLVPVLVPVPVTAPAAGEEEEEEASDVGAAVDVGEGAAADVSADPRQLKWLKWRRQTSGKAPHGIRGMVRK